MKVTMMCKVLEKFVFLSATLSLTYWKHCPNPVIFLDSYWLRLSQNWSLIGPYIRYRTGFPLYFKKKFILEELHVWYNWKQERICIQFNFKFCKSWIIIFHQLFWHSLERFLHLFIFNCIIIVKIHEVRPSDCILEKENIACHCPKFV